MGLGMTSVLVVLGAMREIIGNGTLFDGADLLPGDWAKVLRIEIFHLIAASCLPYYHRARFRRRPADCSQNVIDKQLAARQPKQEKPTIEQNAMSHQRRPRENYSNTWCCR